MTKLIELSKNGKKNRGKYSAIVDDFDYEYLIKYRWAAMPTYSTVYAVRFEGKKCITMHSQILGTSRSGYKQVVDHADGNGLNNTRVNIRITTPSHNIANSTPKDGRPYRGVRKLKNGHYVSKITVDGKRIQLGTFGNSLDAALAYNEALVKYHGEVARLNVIPDTYDI